MIIIIWIPVINKYNLENIEESKRVENRLMRGSRAGARSPRNMNGTGNATVWLKQSYGSLSCGHYAMKKWREMTWTVKVLFLDWNWWFNYRSVEMVCWCCSSSALKTNQLFGEIGPIEAYRCKFDLALLVPEFNFK